MEIKSNLVKLFSLLLFLSSRVFSQLTVASPGIGSCQRPGAADLERIIANSFNLQDGIEAPRIRLIAFNIVCESTGLLRNTLSSFSAVVFYECVGSFPEDNCDNQIPTNLTHQVQSDCALGSNTFSVAGVRAGRVRTTEIQATLNTPPDIMCSFCSERSSIVPSNQVTHCVGMFYLLLKS